MNPETGTSKTEKLNPETGTSKTEKLKRGKGKTYPMEDSPFKFFTKDSGARDIFETGYQRDTQAGKPRYDLIPVNALTRLADLYARGAEKYGEDNWQKGSPFRRTYASLLRHVFAWATGDRSEDHLAAVAWNAFTLMFYEDKISRGELDTTLNDMNIPLENGNE